MFYRKSKIIIIRILCKLSLLLIIFIKCSPPTIIVCRQFGLTEVTNSINKKQIIKIDTVKYGIGFVKRITYKVKQSEYEKYR